MYHWYILVLDAWDALFRSYRNRVLFLSNQGDSARNLAVGKVMIHINGAYTVGMRRNSIR
jgi:hypothetical protein